MEEFNSKQVEKTLKLLIEKLENLNIEYRLLGSVTAASLLGKQHRKLGDLDFIIDKKKSDILFKELQTIGFTQKKGMFSFARKYLALEELVHHDFLEVGFFLGNFMDNNDFFLGSKKYGVRIDATALGPEKMQLYGINFLSISKGAILRGILMSKSNPKRKKELELLADKKITPLEKNYIHVYLFGFKMDFIYYSAMRILDLLGKLRIRFGLAYDPWR